MISVQNKETRICNHYPFPSTLFCYSFSLPITSLSPSLSTFTTLVTYINSLRVVKEVLSQEDKVELVSLWNSWRSDRIVSSEVVHKCHRNCVE